MLVESIDHLPQILEPIKEGWQLNIGVAYSCTNILKPPPRHVLRQPEGRALEHTDQLLQPPHFFVINPLKTCHEEMTAQPDIEILEGRIRPFNIFFCHWDDNIPNKILRGAHPEKINPDISAIELQLWFFRPPFASLMFGSPLLGKVVGVTHSP